MVVNSITECKAPMDHYPLWYNASLVPRPSLTAFFHIRAFFAAVEKKCSADAKKAVKEGLGTRLV